MRLKIIFFAKKDFNKQGIAMTDLQSPIPLIELDISKVKKLNMKEAKEPVPNGRLTFGYERIEGTLTPLVISLEECDVAVAKFENDNGGKPSVSYLLNCRITNQVERLKLFQLEKKLQEIAAETPTILKGYDAKRHKDINQILEVAKNLKSFIYYGMIKDDDVLEKDGEFDISVVNKFSISPKISPESKKGFPASDFQKIVVDEDNVMHYEKYDFRNMADGSIVGKAFVVIQFGSLYRGTSNSYGYEVRKCIITEEIGKYNIDPSHLPKLQEYINKKNLKPADLKEKHKAVEEPKDSGFTTGNVVFEDGE